MISRNDPRYAVIDKAAFASKNLYNAAFYEIRQAFIHESRYISYHQMDKLMKKHEAYKALPAKVAQQVLRLLAKNWQSFFKATQAYRQDPSTFLGRPKLPNYSVRIVVPVRTRKASGQENALVFGTIKQVIE